jgi:hypothetical protein
MPSFSGLSAAAIAAVTVYGAKGSKDTRVQGSGGKNNIRESFFT